MMMLIPVIIVTIVVGIALAALIIRSTSRLEGMWQVRNRVQGSVAD